MISVFVVMLLLVVNDTSTGTEIDRKLFMQNVLVQPYEDERQVLSRAIESCRREGVQRAYDLSEYWQKNGHYWASTNVDCEHARGSSF